MDTNLTEFNNFFNNIIEEDDHDERIIKRRKRLHDPVSATRKINKFKRMHGKEYLGFSRTATKKMKQDVVRPPKKMGNTCTSSYCKKRSNRHCALFDERIRSKMFESFWKLNWGEKQMFVQSLARSTPQKKESKKKQCFKFCLYLNRNPLQVCRGMFLSTLGLKRDMVQKWIKDTSDALFGVPDPRPDPIKEKTQNSNWSKSQDLRKNHLITYFADMEKMDSHYCRADTRKLYLTSNFLSKAELYRNYQETCITNSCKPVSYFTFSTVFDQQSLSLFVPRKDQCDICVSFGVQQIPKEEYDYHIANEKRAKTEKKFDKLAGRYFGRHVFTMDKEAVKLCPNVNASAIFYKQRLQVHNFTMFNLINHQCTAYWWNEIEGDLSASSFTSCVIRHLEVYCLGDTFPITLYSDGCGYQNRNQYLSNALSNFAIKNNKIIEQKFLEKGHTQMECDSVHAKIEKKLKNRPIYVPEQYATVTKEARKTVLINGVREAKPFDVEYLHHSFFKNYADESSLRFNSIRPGNKPFDPTVTQIKALMYLPNGAVMFKLDFDDEYQDLVRSIKPFEDNFIPKPLHTARLKIKEQKWKHLQTLKDVIPIEHHSFYDDLSYIPSLKPSKNGNIINREETNKNEYEPEASRANLKNPKNKEPNEFLLKPKNSKISKRNAENCKNKKPSDNAIKHKRNLKYKEPKALKKNLKTPKNCMPSEIIKLAKKTGKKAIKYPKNKEPNESLIKPKRSAKNSKNKEPNSNLKKPKNNKSSEVMKLANKNSKQPKTKESKKPGKI